MTSAPPPALVCALAYDGLCTFEYGICVELFGSHLPEMAAPLYRFETVGIDPAPMRAAGGLEIIPTAGPDRLRQADLILIPGWRGVDAPVPDTLVSALQSAHHQGARIATICSGVFVLAATGLLSGRRATTHWRYVDALMTRYPDIRVEADVLYIDEGDMLTSAGSAAGIDLCLHIIRGDHGSEVANTLARSLVMPAHREGGQAQFIPRPVPERSGASLAPLLDRLRSEINTDWTVNRIARLAHVSPRTLQRRFQEQTGLSPKNWLVRERIDCARELLETTDMQIENIGETTGLGAPETVRLHFRRIVGISPTSYRKQYRPPVRA